MNLDDNLSSNNSLLLRAISGSPLLEGPNIPKCSFTDGSCLIGLGVQQQQQQQHSLLSQASWGRLEMKPKRDEKQGDTAA
jgi:hypothetical protein